MSGLASPYHITVATIIFLITLFLISNRRVKCLPIGRTLSAVGGAVLMITFQIVTADEAFAAISLRTLFLLLGMMVLTHYLRKAGFFEVVAVFLTQKKSTRSRSCRRAEIVTDNALPQVAEEEEGSSAAKVNPILLLMKISFLSALLSALVTNDAACIFLTPMVIEACKLAKVEMGPYLMATATAANIGSAATVIGNPQNAIIAASGALTFFPFLIRCGIVALVGLVINFLLMLLIYGNRLKIFPRELTRDVHPYEVVSRVTDSESEIASKHDQIPMEELQSGLSSIVEEKSCLLTEPSTVMEDPTPVTATESHSTSSNPSPVLPAHSCFRRRLAGVTRRHCFVMCVYLIGVAVLILLLAGMDLGWTPMGGAVMLLTIDALFYGIDVDATLVESVDWALLIFFSGLFIVMSGFQSTGLPAALFDLLAPHMSPATLSGTMVFACFVLVGSNLISNVPLVLLVVPLLDTLPDAVHAGTQWYVLAFVSTVAGNLTLIGSVANLIVAERSKSDFPLGFWYYFKFGVPSTLLIVAICTPIVFVISNSL